MRWTAFDSVVKTLLRLASIAILARILAPADYGLMAMVSVVMGIAVLFSDLGVNSAFVQRQDVTQIQRSSLFWLNVSTSIGLALVVIALSPLFARLVGDPRLTPIMMLSTSTFVIGALGQQLKMSAEKELHFKAVVIVELISALIGFVLAVMAALSGWGVYSLVLAAVAGSASATILYWIFLAGGWRPMWRLRMDDVAPFLGFGSALVANNIVNYVNRTLDIFLGGRLLGVAELGFYSVPRNLVLDLGITVTSIITRVGFPLISKVQSNPSQVKSIYLRTLNMTSATNAPLHIGIAVFAPDIIAVILGPGWERSGELLRILAIWGGVRSTGNPVGSLLYGMGRAGLALKWNMSLLLVMAPVVWIGLKNGLDGMAWALLLLQIGLFIPTWYFLVRPVCQARLIEYSKAALLPFIFATLAIGPAFFIANEFQGNITRIMTGVVIAVPLYLAISFVCNRDWVDAVLELMGRPLPSAKE